MLFQSKEESHGVVPTLIEKTIGHRDLRRIFSRSYLRLLAYNDESSKFRVNKELVHESSLLFDVISVSNSIGYRML